MITKEFTVSGMSCQHCVKAVNIELENLELASKEVTIGSVKVLFDESKVTVLEIIDAIQEAGFKVVE